MVAAERGAGVDGIAAETGDQAALIVSPAHTKAEHFCPAPPRFHNPAASRVEQSK